MYNLYTDLPIYLKTHNQNPVKEHHMTVIQQQQTPAKVSNRSYYHVTGKTAYNTYSPLKIGDIFEVGNKSNPFFAFFENYERQITLEQGNVPALHFLRLVAEGHRTINDPKGFAMEALNIAKHFQMLSRELLLEEVRLKTNPSAPSRYTALWVVNTAEQAKLWMSILNREDIKIAKLKLTGTVLTVDSRLMVSDSEKLGVSYDKATQYWRGNTGANPKLETLFTGSVEVMNFIEL